MIEVGHFSLALPHKALVVVNNYKLADSRLGMFIDEKLERGYRLRMLPREDVRGLELQSNNPERLKMAIRFLKDAGFCPKKIPFRNNLTLQKIIRKDYKTTQAPMVTLT